MINSNFSLIDTHAHPLMISEKFFHKEQRLFTAQDLINEANDHHVKKIIFVSTTLKDSIENFNLALEDSRAYVSMGIHPCDVNPDNNFEEIYSCCSYIEKLYQEYKKIVAVGEIGLDKYHETFYLEEQKKAFRIQIECALRVDLPIIIHSRNAADETLKIIDEYRSDKLKGVVHCFSESSECAQEWIKRGFFIGVGGSITYSKNAQLRAVLVGLGLDNIILETDGPFLPPEGYRGTINTSKHILTIVTFISNLLQISLEESAQKILHNTYRCFPRMVDDGLIK